MVSEYTSVEEGLKDFTAADLDEIENLAVGLTETECLLYFGIERKDGLGDEDKKQFIKAFNRGRLRGKKNACNHLFTAMGHKGGAAAAISYLKRFGEAWAGDNIDDSEGKGTISFQVNLGER